MHFIDNDLSPGRPFSRILLFFIFFFSYLFHCLFSEIGWKMVVRTPVYIVYGCTHIWIQNNNNLYNEEKIIIMKKDKKINSECRVWIQKHVQESSAHWDIETWLSTYSLCGIVLTSSCFYTKRLYFLYFFQENWTIPCFYFYSIICFIFLSIHYILYTHRDTKRKKEDSIFPLMLLSCLYI